MHKFSVSLLLLLLFLAPSQAQSTEATASDFVLELYDEAGPSLGCLLLEPDMVLTLTGHKAESRWIRDVAEAQTDGPTVEKINRFLEPHGSRLVMVDDELYAKSLVGLEKSTQRSRLPWMEPFDKAEGWSGFSDWRSKQRDKLDNESLELIAFLHGEPDSAVRGRGLEKDVIAHRQRVTTDVPYAEILKNEGVNFRVSPQDAAAPDVTETVQRFSGVLKEVYEDPRVDEVLRSEPFLNARRARRPDLGVGDRTEKWLRGEYDVWSVFDVSSTLGLTVEHERLLMDNIDGLVEKIKAGETPDRWALWLSGENQKRQNTPLDGSQLRHWVWNGAYPESALARRQFYDAVKEVAPGYLEGLATRYLEDWMQEDGSYGERTFILLSHPDIKSRFENLTDADKARVREILAGSEEVLVKAVAQEGPYAR